MPKAEKSWNLGRFIKCKMEQGHGFRTVDKLQRKMARGLTFQQSRTNRTDTSLVKKNSHKYYTSVMGLL